MTARPILFSAPMVRALLEGRKTQTRRVMKPQPHDPARESYGEPYVIHGTGSCIQDHLVEDGFDGRQCPLGQPGDLLWVRETWAVPHRFDHVGPSNIPTIDVRTHYAASEDRGGLLWRPSIHMPRWASRLTLRITDVRVQRVQEISEKDAIAEGLLCVTGDGPGPGAGCKWIGDGFHGDRYTDSGSPLFHVPSDDGACRCNARGASPAQCAFAELWDSLKKELDSWHHNPWVWAISFDVIQANVDAVLKAETQS